MGAKSSYYWLDAAAADEAGASRRALDPGERAELEVRWPKNLTNVHVDAVVVSPKEDTDMLAGLTGIDGGLRLLVQNHRAELKTFRARVLVWAEEATDRCSVCDGFGILPSRMWDEESPDEPPRCACGAESAYESGWCGRGDLGYCVVFCSCARGDERRKAAAEVA